MRQLRREERHEKYSDTIRLATRETRAACSRREEVVLDGRRVEVDGERALFGGEVEDGLRGAVVGQGQLSFLEGYLAGDEGVDGLVDGLLGGELEENRAAVRGVGEGLEGSELVLSREVVSSAS